MDKGEYTQREIDSETDECIGDSEWMDRDINTEENLLITSEREIETGVGR